MSSGQRGPGRKACRFYVAGRCRYGEDCKFSHNNLSSQGTAPVLGRVKNTIELGNATNTSTHEQQVGTEGESLSSPPSTSTYVAPQWGAAETSGASINGHQPLPTPAASDSKKTKGRPGTKRGETPCRAWKSGSCTKGAKCWFGHDPEVQEAHRRAEERHRQAAETAQEKERERLARLVAEEERRQALEAEEQQRLVLERVRQERERLRQEKERVRLERLAAEEEERRRALEAEQQQRLAQERVRQERERLRQERERTRLAEQEAARKAREAEEERRFLERAQEDAAKTVQEVVLGSIVTFGAGVDIRNVITGFECCVVRVKSLPLDAREGEVAALLTQQGIEPGKFKFTGMKPSNDGTQEASIVTAANLAHLLSAGLDELEFRDQKIRWEVGAYNVQGGMGVSSSRDVNVLTVSWRVPFARYILDYATYDEARAKVQELNQTPMRGRRITAEMNSQPPGHIVRNFNPNSVKLSNIPYEVLLHEIICIAGALSVRQLGKPTFQLDATAALRVLRHDMEAILPGGMQSFNSEEANGIMTVRARFSSWDDAHRVQEALSSRNLHYLDKAPRFRLPEPMAFIMSIPVAQYRAQKAQWTSLVNSITDQKACSLLVKEQGNIVRIHLKGNAKQAVGSLKIRVESLAAGELVDGWHRSLGYSGNTFAQRIQNDVGAYMRADWKRRTLKLYGAPQPLERARAMIRTELERLSSQDWTVTLKKQSVGFFIRQGVRALKDLLGEDAVTLNPVTRAITITGGEDARHHLSSMIDESLSGRHALAGVGAGRLNCPICFDEATFPVRLGCGHVYCDACVRHCLSSAVESDQFPLVCIGDELACASPIPLPTIQQFLTPAMFERLLEAAVKSYITKHPHELKYCKTPDCTQFYRAETGSTTVLSCPSCFSSVCSGCDEESHAGMTCADSKAMKDGLDDTWIAQQGGRFKKCPRCDIIIEKNDGCNHMECHCGAHICWRCMASFNNGPSTYEHMRTVHGGIYDEQPHALDVDFAEQQELLRQADERRRLQALRPLAAQQADQVREYQERMLQYQRQLREREEEERLRQLRVRAREQEERRRVLIIAQETERQRQREREAEECRRQAERKQGSWCIIM